MIPCALYLRYSSDRQNERSPEDQEAVCRAYMERNGYDVVAIYVDRAKSGATVHERTDFQRMLADARKGLFAAVCAETTSRYGRDEEDRAAARKRLTFHGITIMTPVDGVVTRLTDGIKAAIDAHQIEDLKIMIRRGMAGVVRDGRHAGGSVYGYRTVPGLPAAKGRRDSGRGKLEIVETEAAIVRRIFDDYIGGATPRAIAAQLNAENVPAPRGAYWRASTINGHARRKTGILQCELYCGRLVWNRAYRVRDPDSKQRVWRYRPESEWQRSEAPHLRIIADDTFEAAQRLRGVRSRMTRRMQQRPKRLLSGLLRCGVCEAGMSKKDIDHGRPRIVCTRMIESRTCGNRRRYYLDEIERIVVGGLRAELGTPDAVAYFVECYNAQLRRSAAGNLAARGTIESDLAEIELKIARAVAAVIDGRITQEESEAHLPALRARRADLAARLGATKKAPAVITLQPAVVDCYLRDLARLEDLVNRDLGEGDDSSAKAIRNLIDTVTIMPTPAGSTPGVIVRGRLNSLLGLDPFQNGSYVGGEGGAG
jgi:site-specific DNA recombinase